MDAAGASTDALSVISFFLTLVGLLGSFFYIHLSDWLRDIIALETKWSINKSGDDKIDARRECFYEIQIKKAANGITKLTSGVVTVFVIIVSVLGGLLWLAQPEKSAAWIYVGLAGISFIVIYFCMIFYLLRGGLAKVSELYPTIEKKVKEDSRTHR